MLDYTLKSILLSRASEVIARSLSEAKGKGKIYNLDLACIISLSSYQPYAAFSPL